MIRFFITMGYVTIGFLLCYFFGHQIIEGIFVLLNHDLTQQ